MNKTAEQLKQDNNSRLISFEGPVCPYCGSKSILRPEAFIYKAMYSEKNYWVCKNYPSCHAYVGTHGQGEWMNYPLGRLANSELRKLKTNAHALFDHIWKTKTISRGKMYDWLRRTMNLSEPDGHIGELDEGDCQTLIQHLNTLYTQIKIKS